MAESPRPILIIDDGDLRDVRELLTELELEWIEARSFEAPELPGKGSLLVTNSRHALSADASKPEVEIHVVVYDEMSRTLRKVLERSGCDLIMERPLGPEAFELVVAQALYAGPERRRGSRVVVSAPVELCAESRAHEATLMQLSLRGCGLLTDQEIPIGREVQVRFPAELTRGEPLEASGPVLSARVADNDPRQRSVAIAFRLMSGPSRRVIASIMERHGSGSELRPRRARGERRRPAASTPTSSSNRRSGLRKRFHRRVLAAAPGMSHVLFACDISAGGMRVRPDANLALGDELKLAIHSRPGQPAVMVNAVVTRDDGEEGVLLRFRDLPDSIAARLESVMEGLPMLRLGEASAARPGVVISEVLERD